MKGGSDAAAAWKGCCLQGDTAAVMSVAIAIPASLIFVFPLTHDIADELDRVGGEILGGVNRSKTFRVMVAYFAFVHKLKNQT